SASTSIDAFAQVSQNEVQKLTFGATTGTLITAGSATFTLALPIGALTQSLTTRPIAYTNDPVQLAKNIQIALNNLLANPGEGVPGTAGALPVSNGNGLGNVVVTALTPIDFAITFQNFMGNVNWPQLVPAVTQGSGSNVTVSASTVYQGSGNALQTVV